MRGGRQLPIHAKFIPIWLAGRFPGIDSDEAGSLQLVDMLPQAGGRDPIFLCLSLRKNKSHPSTAFHRHAEVEKAAACAERMEPLGEQQGISYLDKAFLPIVRFGRQIRNDRRAAFSFAQIKFLLSCMDRERRAP